MLRFADCGYGEWKRDGGTVGPARWPRFDLLWVHEGQLRLRLLDSVEIDIAAGAGVLIYPDTHFVGWATTSRVRASVQHFSFINESDPRRPLWPFGRLRGRRQGHLPLHAPDDCPVEVDISRCVALGRQKATPANRDQRTALLSLILAATMDQPETDSDDRPPWMARLEAWARDRLDQGLTVNKLADHVGYSPSHFRMMFSRLRHQSPGRWLMAMRMRHAARLLNETTLPVKTIAARVGYSDHANFHRAFRAYTGRTPAACRADRPPLA